jgi:hypothetical protein
MMFSLHTRENPKKKKKKKKKKEGRKTHTPTFPFLCPVSTTFRSCVSELEILSARKKKKKIYFSLVYCICVGCGKEKKKKGDTGKKKKKLTSWKQQHRIVSEESMLVALITSSSPFTVHRRMVVPEQVAISP